MFLGGWSQFSEQASEFLRWKPPYSWYPTQEICLTSFHLRFLGNQIVRKGRFSRFL